jgi:hypothetical protein
MSISLETKLKIERTIATFREKLSAAQRTDADWVRRYRSGDESAIDEIVVGACEENGLPYVDYLEGVENDPQLHELQRQCITEVMLGSLVMKASRGS